MTDKIKEAAFKVFPHTNEGNVEDDIDAAKRSIWVNGATSEAAREYWDAAREDEAIRFGIFLNEIKINKDKMFTNIARVDSVKNYYALYKTQNP